MSSSFCGATAYVCTRCSCAIIVCYLYDTNICSTFKIKTNRQKILLQTTTLRSSPNPKRVYFYFVGMTPLMLRCTQPAENAKIIKPCPTTAKNIPFWIQVVCPPQRDWAVQFLQSHKTKTETLRNSEKKRLFFRNSGKKMHLFRRQGGICGGQQAVHLLQLGLLGGHDLGHLRAGPWAARGGKEGRRAGEWGRGVMLHRLSYPPKLIFIYQFAARKQEQEQKQKHGAP